MIKKRESSIIIVEVIVILFYILLLSIVRIIICLLSKIYLQFNVLTLIINTYGLCNSNKILFM